MRVPKLFAAAFAVLALAGCGGSDAGPGTGLSGRIEADGSSTVAPLTQLAAERFQAQESDVQVTVGISGTGGGFERFCRGETDLSNASRAIEDEERQLCEQNGVEFTEFLVANDGIAIVVNPQNDWIDCITTQQLKQIWEPGSKVKSWRDLDPSYPDQRLTLAGPGTDSGTFDFFTGQINGDEGASRSDFNASEDDNTIVQAVSGEKGGLGYFGLSYYEANQDKLKALEVDGGAGCVAPTRETVQAEQYVPLSRPLYIYVKNDSLQRPEVEAFMRFMVGNESTLATDAQFVPLTAAQLEEAKATLAKVAGAE